MPQALDHLIKRLAGETTDRSLTLLEPDVWARVEASGPETRPFSPLRVATVSLALVAGVAVGGAAATAAVQAPKEMGVFDMRPDLAPSTLLEGRR